MNKEYKGIRVHHTEFKDIKIPKGNPKLGGGILMINTEDENGNSTVKYVSVDTEPRKKKKNEFRGIR